MDYTKFIEKIIVFHSTITFKRLNQEFILKSRTHIWRLYIWEVSTNWLL
jgi:hypothetical protein